MEVTVEPFTVTKKDGSVLTYRQSRVRLDGVPVGIIGPLNDVVKFIYRQDLTPEQCQHITEEACRILGAEAMTESHPPAVGQTATEKDVDVDDFDT